MLLRKEDMVVQRDHDSIDVECLSQFDRFSDGVGAYIELKNRAVSNVQIMMLR